MKTVATKIPSVFHRNVDAEGKKKRGEHERSFNNKEKNPGSTIPTPPPPLNPPTIPLQMICTPHPTQNPVPSTSPPKTPPPQAPPLYPNPEPITPPHENPHSPRPSPSTKPRPKYLSPKNRHS